MKNISVNILFRISFSISIMTVTGKYTKTYKTWLSFVHWRLRTRGSVWDGSNTDCKCQTVKAIGVLNHRLCSIYTCFKRILLQAKRDAKMSSYKYVWPDCVPLTQPIHSPLPYVSSSYIITNTDIAHLCSDDILYKSPTRMLHQMAEKWQC